jgi:hypothetical protein
MLLLARDVQIVPGLLKSFAAGDTDWVRATIPLNAHHAVVAGGLEGVRLYRPPGSPWNKIRPITQATSIPKNVVTINQNAFRHSRLLSSCVLGIRNPELPIYRPGQANATYICGWDTVMRIIGGWE